jgi:60 kDa SS-A/Ro ribonucleoprotein
MANKSLFSTTVRGAQAPKTDTRNKAGGIAYKDSAKATLAQIAATGTLNDTYYTKAGDQLKAVKDNLAKVDPKFIGQLAIYARQRGYMKDMPALLVASLATRGDEGREVMKKVFPRVIGNGKMLRNYVQILRSGALGRKSLGSAPKKLVRQFLDSKSDAYLFRASVGNDPSLADIIKMVHPKAVNAQRNALYAYLIGRPYDRDSLPELVRAYEDWKAGSGTGAPPKVDFRQLTSLPLTAQQWAQIAHDGGWHMVRMNLNTFHRHGVFGIKGMEDVIAKKLADPETIRKAMVFPYQLMIAYLSAESNVPHKVREALQDALETAVENVPSYGDGTAVLVDNSGSMGCAITGYRKGATSVVTCQQVAGLIAAAVVRNNRDGKVVCFADSAQEKRYNPRDSVLTNARKFGCGGGGTNISSAFRLLNQKKHKGNLVILVSDMETWAESGSRYGYGYYGTGPQQEWNAYKARNPEAKLVVMNLVANTGYSQFKDKDRTDILKIGGFSDTMWDVINEFALGHTGAEYWLRVIESIDLDVPSA